uniref:Uncharacterized protein n=1 Tax=Cucumis melo TaxID=3656 RepID=A0A9I9E8K5_CUCME
MFHIVQVALSLEWTSISFDFKELRITIDETLSFELSKSVVVLGRGTMIITHFVIGIKTKFLCCKYVIVTPRKFKGPKLSFVRACDVSSSEVCTWALSSYVRSERFLHNITKLIII